MPTVEPLLDVWLLFSEEFPDLYVTVCREALNIQSQVLQFPQASLQPLQFHSVGILDFVGLKERT